MGCEWPPPSGRKTPVIDESWYKATQQSSLSTAVCTSSLGGRIQSDQAFSSSSGFPAAAKWGRLPRHWGSGQLNTGLPARTLIRICAPSNSLPQSMQTRMSLTEDQGLTVSCWRSNRSLTHSGEDAMGRARSSCWMSCKSGMELSLQVLRATFISGNNAQN